MKKRKKKLQLNRETLRNLSSDDLRQVGGAAQCGSAACTQSCQDFNDPNFTNCGQTACLCPYTWSVAPANCDF
jgi:hypothetical protein